MLQTSKHYSILCFLLLPILFHLEILVGLCTSPTRTRRILWFCIFCRVFRPSDLVVGERLGKGFFGQVMKVRQEKRLEINACKYLANDINRTNKHVIHNSEVMLTTQFANTGLPLILNAWFTPAMEAEAETKQCSVLVQIDGTEAERREGFLVFHLRFCFRRGSVAYWAV